jgi:hypothetical protein
MKWKIILISSLFLISFIQVHWACEYTDKIKKCGVANTNNTTREILAYKEDWSYDDDHFVCINKNPEIFSYQIILDAKFKEIDSEIEEYISKLQENKWYYFWKDKQKSYLDAINNIADIYNTTGRFWKLYYEVCSGAALAEELLECKKEAWLSDLFWTWSHSVQIANAHKYYSNTSTTCTKLANQKLAIYKKVSYDILFLNKLAISQDEKKLYMQDERSKYDVLLSKYLINTWYIERIWAKWPSKIKNTSWGS